MHCRLCGWEALNTHELTFCPSCGAESYYLIEIED